MMVDSHPTGPRFALFTHDTFGLGHLRRCMHIARGIVESTPHAAVLLITGSPALGMLRSLPGHADCIKLPTIARNGPEASKPPHLPIPLADVTQMRSQLTQQALRSFDPHVFLVDNFPLGSRRELKPVLEGLRGTRTRTVLGLRDIVDYPETVRRQWSRDGTYEVLDRCYDRILVYGEREILDAAEAYALPATVADRIRYCGYVTNVETSLEDLPLQRARDSGPFVLGTVGGGGDGIPLAKAFVGAARMLDVSALLVTGPLMSPADRAEVEVLAEGCPRLEVRDCVSDLPAHMAAADLVVSMAGYNTVAEILALRRPAILIPRDWCYGEHRKGTAAGVEGEQPLRAEALAKAGRAEVIPAQELSAETLRDRIANLLARGSHEFSAGFDTSGLERVVEHLLAEVDGKGAEAGDAVA